MKTKNSKLCLDCLHFNTPVDQFPCSNGCAGTFGKPMWVRFPDIKAGDIRRITTDYPNRANLKTNDIVVIKSKLREVHNYYTVQKVGDNVCFNVHVSNLDLATDGGLQYKLVKTINAYTLLAENPCREGFSEYLFRWGYDDPDFGLFIKWAEAHGHIGWLLSKGFIIEIKPEMSIPPCPFCGNSKKLLIQSSSFNHYHVLCPHCRARGPESVISRANAIEMWGHQK